MQPVQNVPKVQAVQNVEEHEDLNRNSDISPRRRGGRGVELIKNTSPTLRTPCLCGEYFFCKPIPRLFKWTAWRRSHQHIFLHHQKLSRRRRPSFHCLCSFGPESLTLAGILIRPNVNILVERPDARMTSEYQRRDLRT